MILQDGSGTHPAAFTDSHTKTYITIKMNHVKWKGAFSAFSPELRMVFYFSASLQRLLIPQRCLILFLSFFLSSPSVLV